MLAGVLVDVSGSMKSILHPDLELKDEPISRVQTIFSTIINIAQSEVGDRNDQEAFTLAFGLADVDTCDLLALLDYLRELNDKYCVESHEPLIRLLENNGAPYAGEYVKKYVPRAAAGGLFERYSQNPALLEELINGLPIICKNSAASTVYSTGKVAYSKGNAAYSVIKTVHSGFWDTIYSLLMNESTTFATQIAAISQAIENTQHAAVPLDSENLGREEKIAREHVGNAIRLSMIETLQAMKRPKAKPLKHIVSLLQDVAMMSSSSNSLSSTTQPLSAAQLSTLVSSIEPCIYGYTPMCKALIYALDVFNSASQNLRVLFLLTDGESTDGNPADLAKRFRDCNTYVFACLLTSENITNPRRLYDNPDPNWSNAQRRLFELCSTVSYMHPAMSILLEQNWRLPESGKSRLFLQANHPDVINEFSGLVRLMGESNDPLLNMLGRASLDMYINSSNCNFELKEQKGETCYAYAVATVFHLAMRRIEGREGGIPDFDGICEALIQAYGTNCAITEDVIKKWDSTYRLRHTKVDEREARLAIIERRPVVATFRLSKSQWKAFYDFYKKEPQGILENVGTRNPSTENFGHAVVLIRCDPISLTLMNWRGTEFADRGFFKVQNQSVLNLQFYDVYWTLEDLKESEITAFRAKSNRIGQQIMQNLPASVQNLSYECPECYQCSPACQFIGDLQQATCPKCHKIFKPVAKGLIQSLRRR